MQKPRSDITLQEQLSLHKKTVPIKRKKFSLEACATGQSGHQNYYDHYPNQNYYDNYSHQTSYNKLCPTQSDIFESKNRFDILEDDDPEILQDKDLETLEGNDSAIEEDHIPEPEGNVFDLIMKDLRNNFPKNIKQFFNPICNRGGGH